MAITRLWHNLVRDLAGAAARDPMRRLARLETPPMIPDAATNAKWHEADLHYRQARRQLEAEIREARTASDAAWRTVARFIYSPLTLSTLLGCVVIYAILRALGVIGQIEQLLSQWL